MSSNVFWCFVVNISVERLSLIRFRSFRMKLIFDFLGMANWWWTNNGFLAGSHTFYTFYFTCIYSYAEYFLISLTTPLIGEVLDF